MKVRTIMLALAGLLLAMSQVANAQKLKDCQSANQDQMKANANAVRDANSQFLLNAADIKKYNAMVQEIVDSRDGTPTLKECQARTKKIQAVTDMIAKTVAGADKQIAACRSKNNTNFTIISTTFDSYNSNKTTEGRGGLTPEIGNAYRAKFDSINAEAKAASERGFTMADCTANATRIAELRAIVESACLTNLSGGNKRCIKVPM